MLNKYIAISIGPIVESLIMARKTSELWASSYMFSYIMKNITEELKTVGDVVLPNSGDFNNNINGAGLYPDRIYMYAPYGEDDFIKVDEIISKVVYKFSSDVYECIGKFKYEGEFFTKQEVVEFFKSFFKIYSCIIKIEEGENIVNVLSAYCNSFECQNRIYSIEGKGYKNINGIDINPLQLFLGNIKKSFLLQSAFDKPKERFESLIEISTKSLHCENIKLKNGDTGKTFWENIIKDNIEKDNDEKIILGEFKKNYGDKFKQYHKYMAIVHADGDNIGAIIEKVGKDNRELKQFSERLFNFSKHVADKIIEYGGVPVYLGGDDMLFFSPVVFEKGKTIFSLIASIDELFELFIINNYENRESQKNQIIKPSMSYGISVGYYKTPLYELRNNSFSLLEDIKKNTFIDENNLPKNRVASRILKHSGKAYSFVLNKNNEELSMFNKFIEKNINFDNNFLNSFTYKLESNHEIISKIAGDKVRLDAFLRYNFNENYVRYKPFFDSICDFMCDIYNRRQKLDKEEFNLLYSALRFIDFINAKDID